MQLHLHGLPQDVIIKVINDFVEERQGPERPVNNYADWLLASFGRSSPSSFPCSTRENTTSPPPKT